MRAFLKCLACGGKFCALRDPDFEPTPRGRISAFDFEHLDGRPIVPGEDMICDSCDQPTDLSGLWPEIIKEEAS